MRRRLTLILGAAAFLGTCEQASASDPCGGKGWKMVTPSHQISAPGQFTQSGGTIFPGMLQASRFLPQVQYWVAESQGLQTYTCAGGPRESREVEIGINQKAGTYLFAVTLLYHRVSLRHTPARDLDQDLILLRGGTSRIARAVAEHNAIRAASHSHPWSGRRVRDAILAQVYSQRLRSAGQTFWVVSLSVRPGNSSRSYFLELIDPHTGRVVQTLTSTTSSP